MTPSIALMVLSVLVLLPGSHGVNPGLKIRITQSGLNHVATQAINSLHLLGEKIPDFHGKMRKVDYDITGVSVVSFSSPQSALTIQSGQGVHWSMTGCSAQLAGDWHLGFLLMKDQGSFTVSISNAGLEIGFTLGVDGQGRPTITATGCSASIGRVDVSLHGGASWLYRMFDNQIESAFKNQIVDVLCDKAKDAINVDANQALARMKVVIPIRATGVLDYKMLMAPRCSTGYVDSFHKGEIYYGDHQEAPYTPAAFPESFDRSKMAYIWVSEYLMNTAGWALQKRHVLKYFFTPQTLKPDKRHLVNTTCPNNMCIGNIISRLQDDFPWCTVSVNMSTSKAPTLEIRPTGILGRFEGDIVFFVNFPNKTTKYTFTAHMLANVSLNLVLGNQKITANVTQISPNITVTDSRIGNISGAGLTWIFEYILNPFITSQFNAVGAQGLDLLGTDQFTFVNPTLQLVENAVALSTDLKWIPHFNMKRTNMKRTRDHFQNEVLY